MLSAVRLNLTQSRHCKSAAVEQLSTGRTLIKQQWTAQNTLRSKTETATALQNGVTNVNAPQILFEIVQSNIPQPVIFTRHLMLYTVIHAVSSSLSVYKPD
jgi:hypothetical protein